MSLKKRNNWISTIVALVIIATAFYLYKNNYIVSKTYDYYVYFGDVYGVQKSTPVYLHGVKIGSVSDIHFEGGEKVKVTLSIKKSVQIKDSTVAQIAGDGLAGGRMIKMSEGSSNKILPRRSVLIPELDTTFILMASQIDPMIASAQYNIRSFDSSVRSWNRQIKEGLLLDISTALSGFNKDMKGYILAVSNFRQQVDTTITAIHSFERSTSEVAANIDYTNKSIRNAVVETQKYTHPTLKENLATIKTSVSKVATSVKGITDKDTGVLGPLLHSPKIYKNSNDQVLNAKENVEDIKNNPPTISIIGGD